MHPRTGTDPSVARYWQKNGNNFSFPFGRTHTLSHWWRSRLRRRPSLLSHRGLVAVVVVVDRTRGTRVVSFVLLRTAGGWRVSIAKQHHGFGVGETRKKTG